MKNFLKNTQAATAIEFAFILPVLLLLLLGIIQFGLTLFFDSSLNAGIRAVGRNGVAVGYDQGTGPGTINQIMSDNLGGLYDPTQVSFIIMSFPSFTDSNFTNTTTKFVRKPDSLFPPTPHAPAIPAAQSGQVILYGVKYTWGQTFGISNPFLPKALYSFSIVRDE